jgi:hypothetical protein
MGLKAKGNYLLRQCQVAYIFTLGLYSNIQCSGISRLVSSKVFLLTLNFSVVLYAPLCKFPFFVF